MDLKSLNIFVKIVQLQSFSLAAEEISVTQPTISKAIDSLEEEIGAPLFHKGQAGRKRDTALTYIGEQVYQHALTILDEQQRIFETVTRIQQLKQGKLTIGLPPIGSTLFSRLIAQFHKQYPNIELSFFEVGANAIEDAILAKKVDVGILLGHLPPNLNSIPIIDSPMCLLSRKTSAWKNRKMVSLIELKEESFLLFNDTFRLNPMIIQAAHQVGFEPNIVCKSSQWDFIAKMVDLDVGITLLPKIYCEKLDQEKFSISMLENPSMRWTIGMAWNTTVAMTPAARAWLQIVEENLDQISFF
ncbi:LysR family transcriptional regulator [Acinetobacter schindleri]|uniref:HTH lysR-type domain-containing protein n=2 Tax=Acinetobacter schindleri TaxID=108981 RepID=N8Z6T9_9GAMM|nr:LysR family transcriptional regulator [Acinetobacter schindleri]ENV44606.1 hypothetical protein F955_01398 [Acinetobacter schindleri CIP 107287]QIC62122.1 LysR family transcriptional regulator [Acinetobacter schindleri]QIC66817.1 LysR family transcriptional regulator [Acinetobacter schindleri]UOH75931.1 LysR family transcriptional regulator [Acinetobacter schindleri]